MNEWSTDQAVAAYGIGNWSEGYFGVDSNGYLVARPDGRPDGPAIRLHEVAHEVRGQGLAWPVLIRFTDILHSRIDSLVEAFTGAMEADSYEGDYTAVYPIKVNQQRSVVEHILERANGRVGLEAGSKPELMAVLALAPERGVIICNGYKDREYVRLALIGRLLGHRTYIVVEKLSELALILREADRLGVEPLLGLRIRLASIGAGMWQNTGGEKSKFGLSGGQVLEVIERLRSAGRLDDLTLLHFHLGSQIANIRDIQNGIREAARYYAELRSLGAGIRTVDVGGGLGVDYEGSHSRNYCSMNYSMREYAHNVVHILAEVCRDDGLPCPNIITESGRAVTAHHAVLVANVTDIERAPDGSSLAPVGKREPQILRDLWQAFQGLDERSALESYHSTVGALSEVQGMYTHGVVNLAQRAWAEQIYFAVCAKVREYLRPEVRAHREVLDELNERLADKVFCNFSVFQSLPDVWGIDQVFPIVPLHRLDQAPSRRALLKDLTCDSDGRIDYYVGYDGVEKTLALHEWNNGEEYLLGFFMVGAYQEILGDMHNLFGDTDSVNVVLDGNGGYRLEQANQGDTVDDLLRYVHFSPDELLGRYREKVEGLDLSADRSEQVLRELEEGLHGYTYLEE